MAVTGAIFKALTFNGESSRNYGVYITGSAVYNAPKRDVEMITIPGRNGSFPLDHGRFENIEVTYPAGIFGDDEEDFADAVSDFRNMLCSANGYCRLEDEYNPDEYRMAVYKSGLEVDPTLLKAGEFEITFECKPQRYLKSGEIPVTMGDWTDVETFTGNPIILNTDKEVKNLDVELTPIQDLHGYSKPWAGGANKNLLNIGGVVNQTSSRVTYTSDDNFITMNGTKYGNGYALLDNLSLSLTAGTYYAKVFPISGTADTAPSAYVYNGADLTSNMFNNERSFTLSADGTIQFRFALWYDNAVFTNYKVGIVVSKTSGITEWTPYENICPITGHDSVTVTDTDGGSQSQSKTVTLPHTVYGAGVGVTSGESKETWANIPSYNGETITEPWLSSMDEYVQGATPTTGAQVTYKLATPTDLSTTPTDITLYNGDNVVSSDGDMTLEIGKKITGVDNPTRFESSPEIRVKGYGTVAFNGYQIEIPDAVYGDVSLVEGARKSYGMPVTLGSDEYATSGDTITVTANLPVFFRAGRSGSTFKSGTIHTSPSKGTPSFTIIDSLNSRIEVDGVTFAFSKGTSSTASITVAYDITIKVEGRPDSTHTTTVVYTASYNATDDTIEMTFTASVSPTTIYFSPNRSASRPTINASVYGSKSVLGDPTIIDCENGEAYKVDADKVVPLNRYVDLGTDLPKFATGENPITTTGSITECVIIPRWWKL